MAGPSSGWPDGVTAVPCLLSERGKLFRAGADGPVALIDGHGRAVDLFSIIDSLAAAHRLVYLVDLGGVEGHDPQLDYIQEISRDVGLWVDAGVRTAEQAIDVIVAGAQKATLSSARFHGPEELTRAWELSTNLAFEIEIWDGAMTQIDPGWSTDDPAGLAGEVRALGPAEVVLSFRGRDPDWTLAAAVARGGPTWIAGSVEPEDAVRIQQCGAAGAIYPLGDELIRWAEDADAPPSEADQSTLRDDEN